VGESSAQPVPAPTNTRARARYTIRLFIKGVTIKPKYLHNTIILANYPEVSNCGPHTVSTSADALLQGLLQPSASNPRGISYPTEVCIKLMDIDVQLAELLNKHLGDRVIEYAEAYPGELLYSVPDSAKAKTMLMYQPPFAL
jgi:hypothetical protein